MLISSLTTVCFASRVIGVVPGSTICCDSGECFEEDSLESAAGICKVEGWYFEAFKGPKIICVGQDHESCTLYGRKMSPVTALGIFLRLVSFGLVTIGLMLLSLRKRSN